MDIPPYPTNPDDPIDDLTNEEILVALVLALHSGRSLPVRLPKDLNDPENREWRTVAIKADHIYQLAEGMIK